MGLRKEYLEFIIYNSSLSGAKMLELGNQYIKDGCMGRHKTGKEYFSSVGCYHLSFDTNGKDGAMIVDMETKQLSRFDNEFDIITNSGFSICIEKYKICYDNIYRMCKPGGVMIHILPEKESEWKGNHFVDKKFFKDLAKKQGSTIKTIKILKGLNGNLVCAALIKNES